MPKGKAQVPMKKKASKKSEPKPPRDDQPWQGQGDDLQIDDKTIYDIIHTCLCRGFSNWAVKRRVRDYCRQYYPDFKVDPWRWNDVMEKVREEFRALTTTKPSEVRRELDIRLKATHDDAGVTDVNKLKAMELRIKLHGLDTETGAPEIEEERLQRMREALKSEQGLYTKQKGVR